MKRYKNKKSQSETETFVKSIFAECSLGIRYRENFDEYEASRRSAKFLRSSLKNAGKNPKYAEPRLGYHDTPEKIAEHLYALRALAGS
jgi:hypothetical protein